MTKNKYITSRDVSMILSKERSKYKPTKPLNITINAQEQMYICYDDCIIDLSPYIVNDNCKDLYNVLL